MKQIQIIILDNYINPPINWTKKLTKRLVIKLLDFKNKLCLNIIILKRNNYIVVFKNNSI
jgi:hypothetical protein